MTEEEEPHRIDRTALAVLAGLIIITVIVYSVLIQHGVI